MLPPLNVIALEPTVEFFVLARDAATAAGVANERRLKLLASGDWTTDYEAWHNARLPPGQYRGVRVPITREDLIHDGLSG